MDSLHASATEVPIRAFVMGKEVSATDDARRNQLLASQ